MKKALLIASAVALAAAPAFARVDVSLFLGAPEPTYVEPSYVAEPAPVYVEAPAYPDYYHHRHFHHEPPHDWHDHGHGHDHH